MPAPSISSLMRRCGTIFNYCSFNFWWNISCYFILFVQNPVSYFSEYVDFFFFFVKGNWTLFYNNILMQIKLFNMTLENNSDVKNMRHHCKQIRKCSSWVRGQDKFKSGVFTTFFSFISFVLNSINTTFFLLLQSITVQIFTTIHW